MKYSLGKKIQIVYPDRHVMPAAVHLPDMRYIIFFQANAAVSPAVSTMGILGRCAIVSLFKKMNEKLRKF
jgi:hypothetical protein